MQTLRRLQSAAITAACVLLMGAASVPLLISPALRLVEAADSGAERNEQASAVGRIEQLRHLRPDLRKSAIAFALPAWPSHGGHTQHFVLNPPRGHRLPNGLLAPLMC